MKFRRIHVPVVLNSKPVDGVQPAINLLLINAVDFLLINANGDKLRVA